MKTIVTLDKADQPYGFPQLDGFGHIQPLLQNLTINGSLSQGIESRNFINSAFAASFYEGTASLNSTYNNVVSNFNVGELLYIYDTSLPKDPWQIFPIQSVDWDGTVTSVTVKDGYWITTPEVYIVSAQYLRDNYKGNGDKQIPSEFTHAEGYNTIATGRYSHAEGYNSQALINASHAEGYNTQALNWAAHAEGFYTMAQGAGSHSEGVETTSQGFASHAEGWGTIAAGDYQHVSGRYNQTSSFESAFIHGSGADNNNRSNLIFAHGTGSKAVVEITGSLNIAGNIYLGSGSIITENSSSTIISPPGALPGQTLVIRPTVAVWGTTSSGFIVYGDAITISILCLGNTVGLGTGYFGTLNYEITGVNVTEQSLGRPLTGQVTFEQGQAAADIIWTIPSNSNITDFTLTITSVAGTYLSTGPGYSGDTTLYYNFEANGLPNGAYITVTNNGVVNSEHSHVHLVSGNPAEVDIYLGDDDQYVKIEKNAGDVVVGTNLDTYKWVFDTSGSLTAPGNITAPSFTGSLFGTASYSDQAASSSYSNTASFAPSYLPLTGGTIIGNLNVIGSASFTYVTASVVSVGTNIIVLNTNDPAARFGGITVIDSGSFGNSSTGSIYWDSLMNRWIYANPSGSTYDGGMLISGPRNTLGIGNEQGTLNNYITKGQGGDHITSSMIYEDSSNRVGIGTSLPSASLHVKGAYTAATSASFLVQNSNASSSMAVFGDNKLKVYSPTNNSTANLWSDDSSAYLGTSGIGAHISMAIGTNTTTYSQAGVFQNGVTIAGSPWFGYVLNLTKGSYITDDYLRWESGKINSSGSLGIGTLSPSASLDVSGSARITNGLSVTGSVNVIGAALITGSLGVTGSLNVIYGTLAGDGITVKGFYPRINLINTGSTAIGSGGTISTTDSSYGTKAILAETFALNVADAGNSIVGGIRYTKSTSIYTNVLIHNNASADASQGGIYISGSTAGFVGIGKQGTLNAKLDVSGSGAISGSLSVVNTSPSLLLRNVGTGGAGNANISAVDTTYASKTAGNAIFSINVADAISTNVGSIQYTKDSSTSSNTSFKYNSFGNTAIYISGSGNVGINKTNPSVTLDISGSVSVTGSLNISGSITMPNRPAFRVTGSGGATSATTTLSGSMTGVDYNQGNAWNNTTGTFTAPIAGLYQVNIVARTNSNSLGTISQVIVYKNDTNAQIMIEWAANTTTNHIGGSTISKLAVGDTLKAVVSAGTISFDLNDNFSVAYIG